MPRSRSSRSADSCCGRARATVRRRSQHQEPSRQRGGPPRPASHPVVEKPDPAPESGSLPPPEEDGGEDEEAGGRPRETPSAWLSPPLGASATAPLPARRRHRPRPE
jgi:hypothetical protein